MRKMWFAGLLVVFGVAVLPNSAAALSCPSATSTPPLQNANDNVYTVEDDPAVSGITSPADCVTEYSGGNLNGKISGGGGRDDFLDGPTDSTSVTDGGTYFGGGWTSFCTSDVTKDMPDAGTATCQNAYGFSYTGTTDGTFQFTGQTNKEYALGIKDGSDPFWAVFLLATTSASHVYAGTWSILAGSTPKNLSHFVIYDRDTDPVPAPEPASLLLLGSGLALLCRRLRRHPNPAS